MAARQKDLTQGMLCRRNLCSFRALAIASMAVTAIAPGAAQAVTQPQASVTVQTYSETIVRVPAAPSLATPARERPAPPKSGRKRCIDVAQVAGAVVYGDRAVELTLNTGKRWRMYLAQGCPTLSFYQGFYYRRVQAGQLCAGRDVIIARSGGECSIVSIMPVSPQSADRAGKKD